MFVFPTFEVTLVKYWNLFHLRCPGYPVSSQDIIQGFDAPVRRNFEMTILTKVMYQFSFHILVIIIIYSSKVFYQLVLVIKKISAWPHNKWVDGALSIWIEYPTLLHYALYQSKCMVCTYYLVTLPHTDYYKWNMINMLHNNADKHWCQHWVW